MNQVLDKTKNQFIIYQTEDGKIRIDVKYEDETVWLTQAEMVELFGSSKSNISEHIKHIFEDGELLENEVVRFFRTTATDGKTYNTKYYNLDMIISVGYRVKSITGIRFRIWATSLIKEYIKKGFALDDERMKNGGNYEYFEELLARIREIRASEKVFWRKVLDIYATSIDYDPKSEITKNFFKTVQNKIHFATHGHTAAELIYERVDSRKPYMGLTSWKGNYPKKTDIEIAKNYLDENEITILNRIVMVYLEFAELQALSHKPMYMKDWIIKLDKFLVDSDREVLKGLGNISHEEALKKAQTEYEKYQLEEFALTNVEKDFLENLKQLEETVKE